MNEKLNSKKGQKEYLHPYVQPTYTNRGAGHTSESGLRACVDWVEATFKNFSNEQLICDVLQLDISNFLPAKGANGYRQSLRNGSIAIYFDGHEDMGIHLEMKGRGCREYESYGKRSWKDLFTTIFAHHGTFTRLDPAVDDFEGIFTIKGLVRRVKKGELISKFERARNYEDIIIKTGDVRGVTLKFGSPKSNLQVIMYDKLTERVDSNYRVSEEVTTWNRTELRLRDEKANQVAKIIATREDGEETIGQTVCGILKDYMRFTVKGKDSNRSRWKTAPFWTKFLGKVEALPLTTIMEEQTIEDKEEWLDKQVAPALALVYEAYDGDIKQIEKLLQRGKQRLKQKDYNMIEKFKEQKKTSLVCETKEASNKTQ